MDQPTPAQAYAQFQAKKGTMTGPLAEFRNELSFELDDFQLQACSALSDGRSVLVAAPTGAGKTIVAQFAVKLAVSRGVRVFYTAPIKALSNQKFNELCDAYGEESVGLLTGDVSIRRDAQIMVMTTEVLRNMIYSGTDLSDLGFVVLDEVHYLGDRFRGPVWEEVIIHLPIHVLLVSLSATVSNAEEFGAWLAEVRGSTDVIVSEHRPVPLHNHACVGTDIFPLFAPRGFNLNKELERYVRRFQPSPGNRRRGRYFSRFRRPARSSVIEALGSENLLPAIFFIFSRNGCDDALDQCLAGGVDLTSSREKQEIALRLDDLSEELPAEDLGVLGFHNFSAGLIQGIGVHHAGLIPQFKEVVEELFVRGLLRVVFATETLALGINMPARTVVLEKLTKFNGESHVQITPGEYTQLTGRAGRRGIDVEGHAVTVWNPQIELADIAALASKRTYALKSQFTPTYNMAANLLARMTSEDAKKVLETSFAQYQADAAVVGLARKVRSKEETLAGYESAMECSYGDFSEYAGLRRTIAQLEKRASNQRSKLRQRDVIESLSHLSMGDTIFIPSRRGFGACVVLQALRNDDHGVRLPTVLTESGKVWHLRPHEVTEPAVKLGRIKLPKKFNHRVVAHRRQVQAIVETALDEGRLKDPAAVPRSKHKAPTVGQEEIQLVRQQLRDHPCHECPDRETHARWAERAAKVEKELSSLTHQIEGRTSSIAHVFDRVCNVLVTLKFLPDDSWILRRIYGERDLLTAMSVRAGIWDRLTEPEVAALASSLVYQARREEGGVPRLPSKQLQEAFGELQQLWSQLFHIETDSRLPITPEPDPGMMKAIFAWTEGKTLSSAMGSAEFSAGDFVRWAKQTLDLLGQVENVVEPGTAKVIKRAAMSIRRGVVLDS